MPQQVKASLWFVICGFLQKGITFLTTPIFSRLLSTSEYGLYNVFVAWQNIITVFASLNLASGVYLRGQIKYEEDRGEFTASLQSLYMVNFVIVFSIYLAFSDFWNSLFELPTKYICIIFADILFQVSFHFLSARQRIQYKYRALVVFTLVNAILRPTLGVVAILNCTDKVTARVSTMLLVDALVFGYFFLLMFIKKGKKVSTKYWRYALEYNIPLVPHYLSQIVLNQSDRIMIKSLTDSGFAGIYSLAYSAAAIMTIVNQSILNSYNPWMYQKIRDKQYGNIGRVSYSLLCIVGGLNLFLIICAPEVILILAPESYHKAIWVIPPVAMSTFFMFLYSLFANFEFYYEKTKFMMFASVAGAILNIILNYIFIPKFGFLAAGYTTLICYLCYCIAHYILMKKILKKELPSESIYNMRIIMGISIVFIVVGAVFMLLYDYVCIRYVIVGIILIVGIIKRKELTSLIKNTLSLKKEKNKA